MRSSLLRSTLFMLTAASMSIAAGCATDDEDTDEYGDVDGEGKGDGWGSTSPERLADTPFYFSVPKSAVSVPLNRAGYTYPTLWNKSMQGDEDGLRIIAIKQLPGVAAHKTARHDMAKQLAASGVLQEGDLVLTFRPELAGTMAYPHIQMGVTHAGLVYVQDGKAFNIDSPLDSEYVGQFDTSHYAGNGGDDAGVDALHIVRPRVMNDPTRKANLHTWIADLKANLADINGARQQIKFQSDYLTPAYVSHGMTPRQTVTLLGKIILEEDTTSKLPMFCSEFAWHMIALSGCTEEDIRNAPPEGAACVDPAFEPLPLISEHTGEVGLAEGPLVALNALPAASRPGLVDAIFADGNPAKLSSGHRMVSEQVKPLMAPLSQIYAARAAGATAEQTAEGASMLNVNVPNNYSPTTFLVEAMGDAATRPVDYVATVAFVNGSGYQKAVTLSHNPVP